MQNERVDDRRSAENVVLASQTLEHARAIGEMRSLRLKAGSLHLACMSLIVWRSL
jgi:hypothetical protein